MKKFIFLSIFVVSLHGDYNSLLINANNELINSNYQKAEELLTQAIEENNCKADAYIDRAQVRLNLNKHEQAIEDLNESKKYEKSFDQTQKGLLLEMQAYAVLNKENEAMEAWGAFKKNQPNLPYQEETEDYIIIHNAIDHPIFKNMISHTYIKAGICNKEDIKWMDGKCIIKKKP
jgi:tetratricopeptide (TPR) repeat protein